MDGGFKKTAVFWEITLYTVDHYEHLEEMCSSIFYHEDGDSIFI
jgi:hypothetical protein